MGEKGADKKIKRSESSEVLSRKFRERLKAVGIVLSDSSPLATLTVKPVNGKKSKKRFGDVYRKYCELHLPTISEASRVVKLRRCERFTKPLLDIKMQDISTEVMNEFMVFAKERHATSYTNSVKKFNHDKSLKDLKSIFNWFIETFDPSYYNPVRKSHFRLGVLEEIPIKEKRVKKEELLRFLKCLRPPYDSIAYVQLYAAARIGEIAGIQAKNICLESRRLLIREILVWIAGLPKEKKFPKNGHQRSVFINDAMAEIFKNQIKNMVPGCPFIFHKNGKPLRYAAIQEAYNRAWKKAGLHPKFSGTHLIRYQGAMIARKTCGSIDAAMAVTGHRSVKLAEKYSSFENLELNKKASNKMLEFMELDDESA